MRSVSVFEFANWVDGWADGFLPSDLISTFTLDSREVQPGDLFLAIKGERVDGHDYVEKALEVGAVGSLAERDVPGPSIQVPNLVDALAMLGTRFRNEFKGPVVAITGSAGKTTTKEFVASALSPLGPILKTQGNRNTEYTAPLLWTELESSHRAVVVEMSMRGFGQIRHLASFSKPTIGLITNVGYAHMEQVGSRDGIAKAKGELLELLPSDGYAVLWHEDEFLKPLMELSSAPVVTFGADVGADCRITGYRAIDWQLAHITGTVGGMAWEAEVPVVGRHIALNVAAAMLVASVLGVDLDQAAAQLINTVLPPMRMEVIELNGATVLLDTYNASPPSMIAAIETISELPVPGRRYAVIGDMRELGAYTEQAHREVGRSIAAAGFSNVLFYGPSMEIASEEAETVGMSCFETARTIDEVRRFLTQVSPGDAVLIKGSRSLELEDALK